VADDVPESAGKGKALTESASDLTGKVRTFVSDVVTEIRKTSWPSRQELVESTWVVIVMVLALGLYIFLCDWILIRLLGWLIPRG
jgi:preprotein translocase subunit SecE